MSKIKNVEPFISLPLNINNFQLKQTMEKTVIEMKDVDFTTMKFKTDVKHTKTNETKAKNDEFREDQLNDMILVTKLDNVFMSIKNKPNYFYRLKMLICISLRKDINLTFEVFWN